MSCYKITSRFVTIYLFADLFASYVLCTPGLPPLDCSIVCKTSINDLVPLELSPSSHNRLRREMPFIIENFQFYPPKRCFIAKNSFFYRGKFE